MADGMDDLWGLDWSLDDQTKPPEITGQFVIRDACTAVKPPKKGGRVVLVMGVLALPKTSVWKGEYQYVVAGVGDTMKVFPESGVDLTDQLAGYRADQVFTLRKIWRV